LLQAQKCCRIDFINLLQISENLKIKKCKFAIFSKNLMALKSRCINNFKYLIDVSIKLHSLPDQIFGFSYKSESLKIGNGANFFALRVVFIYYIILYYYIYKQEKKSKLDGINFMFSESVFYTISELVELFNNQYSEKKIRYYIHNAMRNNKEYILENRKIRLRGRYMEYEYSNNIVDYLKIKFENKYINYKKIDYIKYNSYSIDNDFIDCIRQAFSEYMCRKNYYNIFTIEEILKIRKIKLRKKQQNIKYKYKCLKRSKVRCWTT